MKTLVILFLLFSVVVTVVAQTEKSIAPQWKLSAKDTLNYNFTEISLDSFNKHNPIKDFPPELLSFIDSLKTSKKAVIVQDSLVSESPDIFDAAFDEVYKHTFFFQLTQQKPDIIDVRFYSQLTQEGIEEMEDSWNKIMESGQKEGHPLDSVTIEGLNDIKEKSINSLLLHGSIYAKGGMHSFYLPSPQKNIIALFFELPQKRIQIGDSWDLDVQLTSFNFGVCDTVYKEHKVLLKEIKKQGQDQIAIFNYNFEEFVSGDSTTSKYVHHAIAEFSINQGKWLKYDAYTSINLQGGLALLAGPTGMNTEAIISMRPQ